MAVKKKGSTAQIGALTQLRTIAALETSPLIDVLDLGAKDGNVGIRIRLRTGDLEHVAGGLALNDEEDVLLVLPESFPLQPPEAHVEHERFVGSAHVLQGTRLCVYLNPTQEWHPNKGIPGFMEDLWSWFDDATAGRFDPSRALFHPVGGVAHHTPGTPLIVVRAAHGFQAQTFSVAHLTSRTSERLDLVDSASAGSEPILLVTLSGPLRYGAGMTIGDLLSRVQRLGHPKPEAIATLLAQSTTRGSSGSPAYFLLAVPFPSGSGTMDHHLIAGRLPAQAADRLRQLVAKAGALAEVSQNELPLDTTIEWCRVSDERQTIATRRDATRPVSALLGANIEIWGCGGLGAWMAEFIARAGARHITICDPYPVVGGLLVRQNYVEDDVGQSKADALAERLRSIRDDLVVTVRDSVTYVLAGDLPACDLLVDATVNLSVGACICAVWSTTSNHPVVARVAIDSATAAIGMAAIARPPDEPTIEEVDEQAGVLVSGRPALERFEAFWRPPSRVEELVPERGCSVPTFHGSAADLAATAAVLVNLLAPHIKAERTGVHLVALPHAPGRGASHIWLPQGG